jgi:hypothetical protein
MDIPSIIWLDPPVAAAEAPQAQATPLQAAQPWYRDDADDVYFEDAREAEDLGSAEGGYIATHKCKTRSRC